LLIAQGRLALHEKELIGQDEHADVQSPEQEGDPRRN
jgi:hypothetical protein